MKGLISVLAMFVLTACIPDTEISINNAETILVATSLTNEINTTVKLGVGAQASLAKSLSRMSVQASRSFNVVDDCSIGGEYLFTGKYADRNAGDSGDYYLAFNRCASSKGTLDGVVSGSFTGTLIDNSLDVEYSAKGDVDFKLGKQSINVSDFSNDVSLDVRFNVPTEMEYVLYSKHAGLYTYDTQQYKGAITAKTTTEVMWHLVGEQVIAAQGEVVYTDSSNNELKVVHNTNGVSTYVNTTLLNTYSHTDWLNKF